MAAHKDLKDCWIILYGKVYDVTKFIYTHPGGSAKLLQCAGTGRDHQKEFEDENHGMLAKIQLK